MDILSPAEHFNLMKQVEKKKKVLCSRKEVFLKILQNSQ